MSAQGTQGNPKNSRNPKGKRKMEREYATHPQFVQSFHDVMLVHTRKFLRETKDQECEHVNMIKRVERLIVRLYRL